MTAMRIIPGKHCKKDMDIRITDVRENEDDPSSITSWLIYGLCEKCKSIFICELFVQLNKPILGQDYLIDYKHTAQGSDLKIENTKTNN